MEKLWIEHKMLFLLFSTLPISISKQYTLKPKVKEELKPIIKKFKGKKTINFL